MAKPKSPLLSLGARGTIADALTYQKRGREHIVREKPIPRDPYSLNQAYQRWDYRDYAYLWTLLSNSEKQVYRTRASRYHITGYSLWMREHLKDLPDLAGRWHLDEKGGATAYDSSRNTNHGTIYGTSPATAIINGGYTFDGIDDYIDIPHTPSLNITSAITIEAFVQNYPTAALNQPVLAKWKTGESYYFYVAASGIYLVLALPAGVKWVKGDTIIFGDNIKHHIAGTYDGSHLRVFLDGLLDCTPVAATGDIAITTENITIGRGEVALVRKFVGLIDHVPLYNRALSPTEILRHSERRYP